MTKPAIYEGYPEPHKVTGHNIASLESSYGASTEVVGCCVQSSYDKCNTNLPVRISTTDDWSRDYDYARSILDPHGGIEPKGGTKTHRIWLRKNFEAVVELPEDVTPSELNRLCSFLDLLVEP